MPTIDVRILESKALKDQTHILRLSIAHNGQTRYMKTDIIVEKASQLRGGSIVNRPDAAVKNLKLRRLMDRAQNIIDSMDYVQGLTCSELVALITQRIEDDSRAAKIHMAFNRSDKDIT